MPGRGRGRPPHAGILTPAEQRVLEELRRGGTNVEIAARLGLSPETVKTHIASMLAKLGLDDRRELASWRPDQDRRRVLGLLAVPPALASLGRPLLWAGTALGGIAVVTVVVVLLVAFLGDADDERMVLPPAAVGSCDSGVAVPDPATSTELVEDCESLMKAKDRLAGTATLNWSVGRAMTNWEGVTVAGTPQRVTQLELADSGLTGELTGLLGNLTGLTHLRLNANALTGKIPSKLQLLTSLTHAYLAGSTLTGCVPPSLRTVANNDIALLGLADCAAPIDISPTAPAGDSPLTAGTYSFTWKEGDPPLVFDVPEGLTLKLLGYSFVIRSIGSTGGPIGLILQVAGGESEIAFDVYGGEVWGWYIAESAEGASGTVGASPQNLEGLFTRVSESTWLGEAD